MWDNPGDGRNPVYNPSKIIKPTAGVEHSWITMTNDGKLAFLGDSSVIDVKTHKEIAVMKDEFGRRIVHTEKLLYLTFKDGKLIETNNQFAVGDAKAYAARMAAEDEQLTGPRVAARWLDQQTGTVAAQGLAAYCLMGPLGTSRNRQSLPARPSGFQSRGGSHPGPVTEVTHRPLPTNGRRRGETAGGEVAVDRHVRQRT